MGGRKIKLFLPITNGHGNELRQSMFYIACCSIVLMKHNRAERNGWKIKDFERNINN